MKQSPNAFLKADYQRLRHLSCEQLWLEEVPRFNALPSGERSRNASVIRAVGVVFSESGTPAQKEEGRVWLRSLLQDPEEKVRRYAVLALPKMDSGEREEAELLQLLRKAESGRETGFVAKSLGKFGATATLEAAQSLRFEPLQKATQRLEANVARNSASSRVLLEKRFSPPHGLQVQLRCRSGLESFVKEEVLRTDQGARKFRIAKSFPEMVSVEPCAPFSLGEIYRWRCFARASFFLGNVGAAPDESLPLEALAGVIASPLSQRLLQTLTEGPVRYRIEFLFKGVSRGAMKELAALAYQRSPRLLNDSREAPWEIQILKTTSGYSVELAPRLRPDPRFDYRSGDVPAASHPPLAACIAQLAGAEPDERIWDPFCGSGLELVERVRLGGVTQVFGTDLNPEAIALSESHLAAVPGQQPLRNLSCRDFRDFRGVPGLGALSLILTNPPLGHRVAVPDLRGMIERLFEAAVVLLRPGGRLVLVNPLGKAHKHPALRLEFRQKVDLGFTHCHLEKYVKVATSSRTAAASGKPFGSTSRSRKRME